MADPFIGQIDLFPYTFAPLGYLLCDGQIYPIRSYQPLYALIGNTYGGSLANQTFAVPNLQGVAFVGVGTVPGGTIPWTLGKTVGTTTSTITQDTMPAHHHALNMLAAAGAQAAPAATNALSGTISGEFWGAPTPNATLAVQALAPAYTGGMPHDNKQPYTVLRPCIAVEGIFPVAD